MNIKKPHYYDSFKCVAGKCPNTCCTRWRVDVDDDTCAKYLAVEGDMGRRLHKSAVDKMMEVDDQNCIFYTEDGLCEIQQKLGENMLCQVCQTFPRFQDQYGMDRELILSLACPEVARIVLTDKKGGIIKTTEEDIELTEYSEYDTRLYPHFVKARDLMLDMVHDARFSFVEKLNLLYAYAKDLVPHMPVYAGIPDVVRRYMRLDSVDVGSVSIVDMVGYIAKALEPYMSLHYNDMEIFTILANTYDFYKNISDTLSKNMSRYKDNNKKRSYGFTSYNYTITRLKEALADTSLDKYYQNLLHYFLHKHILTSVYDYEVLEKTEFCITSTLICKWVVAYLVCMGEDIGLGTLIDISHRYSRAIEHHTDNMQVLYKSVKKKSVYKKDFKKLISEVESD